MHKVLFVCHGNLLAEERTPNYAALCHSLRGLHPIRTTSVLL